MNVAAQAFDDRAARLMAGGLHRFHVLDLIGLPMCMSRDRAPIYPVDYDSMIGAIWVPKDQRCHRWGCNEAWVELTHADGH